MFRTCENLEELRLQLRLLLGTTDFSNLRLLKALRYVQTVRIANHPHLPIDAFEPLNAAPTTLFSQLPLLVDLIDHSHLQFATSGLFPRVLPTEFR